jgi:hypothetical protein
MKVIDQRLISDAPALVKRQLRQGQPVVVRQGKNRDKRHGNGTLRGSKRRCLAVKNRFFAVLL